jgi:uncharacterized protein (DUF736 family)
MHPVLSPSKLIPFYMNNIKILDCAFFENRNKKTENHPDFTGSIETLIGKLNIAVWKKTSKTGTPYHQLVITKQEKNNEIPTTQNS